MSYSVGDASRSGDDCHERSTVLLTVASQEEAGHAMQASPEAPASVSSKGDTQAGAFIVNFDGRSRHGRAAVGQASDAIVWIPAVSARGAPCVSGTQSWAV